MSKRALVLAVFLLSLPLVYADVVGDMFSGLGIDIVQTYKSSPVIIDFIIYMMIFTALANIAFKDKVSQGGGQGLALGIGAALSIGITFYTASRGWNLGMAGPIAGAILVIVVGFGIFEALRRTGMKATGALALAYFVGYWVIRSAFPELYSMITVKYQTLEIIMFAAFVLALFQLVSWLLQAVRGETTAGAAFERGAKGSGARGWFRGALRLGAGKIWNRVMDRELSEADQKKRTTKVVQKEMDLAIKDIQEVKEIIYLVETYKDHPENLKRIGARLKDLRKSIGQGRRLKKKQSRINEHIKRISKKLGNDLKEAKKKDVKDEVEIEKIEMQIKALEEFNTRLIEKIKAMDEMFVNAIGEVVTRLNATDAKGAVEKLNGALMIKERTEQFLIYEKEADRKILLEIMVEEEKMGLVKAALKAA